MLGGWEPLTGGVHVGASLMTQAREVSRLHVRLEEAGDQKGESLAPCNSPQPSLRGLALGALCPRAGAGVGGPLHAGPFPLVPQGGYGGGVPSPASSWARRPVGKTRASMGSDPIPSLSARSCFQGQKAEFSLWYLGPVRVHRRPRWARPPASTAWPAGSRS